MRKMRKSLTLLLALTLMLTALTACGGNTEDAGPSSEGNGGAAGEYPSKTVTII